MGAATVDKVEHVRCPGCDRAIGISRASCLCGEVLALRDDRRKHATAMRAAGEEIETLRFANSRLEEDVARLKQKQLECGCHHPGYLIGMHWLAAAYDRICVGEPENDVLADYGWKKEQPQ